MTSLRELRERIRTHRLEELAEGAQQAVAGRAELEVWLFGSWARGDWDARSDVDMIAVAPTPEEALATARAVLAFVEGLTPERGPGRFLS